ncbi:hypothetical protein K461DRAFT_291731 [Myriangium duriaei CBS 260.36]|uniref:Uncharacterized protein n=1 Tax=Myriangium duriaei CBS 260.36 TaxID=1168546 RepID=A0A9P4J669_9PEZI|nr:hypothetical protein K461DRAFT_291731 [Myriangium duriaei CBS 260.36]
MSTSQSTAGSAFNSSSSLSSMSSFNTHSNQSPVMDQQNAPRLNSAPLPSPSQTGQSNYFEAFRTQMQVEQQQVQAQQGYQQMGQNMSQNCGAGPQGSPETASFLNNLNLVAEAAKRAQMACLMRDFGEVEL